MTIHAPNGYPSRPPMSVLLRACADLIDAAIGASGRQCGFVFILAERQKDVLTDCHVVSDLTQEVATRLVERTLERLETEIGETQIRPSGDKP
jgi:hypothetical protein